MEAKSSCAEVTPKITEVRERSMRPRSPLLPSSSTFCATISASNCAVSVAGTVLGGTPKPIGSKGTSFKNAPRLA